MLLRVRVTLPDRPGTLGQVARTLGVSGADIVQVVVLERLGGRAVDDFTVVWPGAARVEGLLAGLAAIPGVRVDGVWRAIGAPTTTGQDANCSPRWRRTRPTGWPPWSTRYPGCSPRTGRWPPSCRSTGRSRAGGRVRRPIGHASWRAPEPPRLPEVTPLRARTLTMADGTHYAIAPFGRAGLVLVVARDHTEPLTATGFHATEVDRLAQLVRASAVILGDRLDLVGPQAVTTVT